LIKGNLTQRDENLDISKKVKFLYKIRPTVFDFLWGGSILRRCTSNGGCNITTVQFKSVIQLKTIGLIGKTELIECIEQPFPAPIACKHSTGSVTPMSGWGQPNNQNRGIRVPKTGERS